MTLGVLHLQLAQHKFGVAAQHNVSTAACHVGGDGHGTQTAGLGNNLGLFHVIFGVKHIVGDAALLQHLAQHLGFLNGNGADQNRLPGGMTGGNILNHGVKFTGLGAVNNVGQVVAHHRLVGGDNHHIHAVNGAELFLLSLGGTGHAGQLIIHTEVILQGNAGQRLALITHNNIFLGLDSLVQTVAVTAALHQTAGKFINNDDLVILYHIIAVFFEQMLSLQSLLYAVVKLGVDVIVKVLHIQLMLHLGQTGRREHNGTGLFIHRQVLIHTQTGYDFGHLIITGGGFICLAADDEGSTGFVNQNAVNLVDNGIVKRTLHLSIGAHGHIVTQVIKAELIVGAEGDVAHILQFFDLRGDRVPDQADGKAEEAVQLAHPLAVTRREVLVDGNNVYALAGQRIKINGAGGHQRFTFAGFHLGNTAVMQGHAADELNIEVTHTKYTHRSFSYHGKGLHQQIIQRGTIGQTLFELGSFGFKLFIAQRLHLRFQRIDFVYLLGVFFDFFGITVKKIFEKTCHYDPPNNL